MKKNRFLLRTFITWIIAVFLFSFSSFAGTGGGSGGSNSGNSGSGNSSAGSGNSSGNSGNSGSGNSGNSGNSGGSSDGSSRGSGEKKEEEKKSSTNYLRNAVSPMILIGAGKFNKNVSANQRHMVALKTYLIENKKILQRDIYLSTGPVFQDLGNVFQLSQNEISSIKKSLEGSQYQENLVKLLNREISDDVIWEISMNLHEVLKNSLTSSQMKTMLDIADRTIQSGSNS